MIKIKKACHLILFVRSLKLRIIFKDFFKELVKWVMKISKRWSRSSKKNMLK
jgi:hypothetical protein